MKSEMKKIISDIIALLSQYNESDWVRMFEYYKRLLDDDYEEGLYKLKSLYGGMGSFNDLVLHENGLPLKEKNNELDLLRHNLYDLLH